MSIETHLQYCEKKDFNANSKRILQVIKSTYKHMIAFDFQSEHNNWSINIKDKITQNLSFNIKVGQLTIALKSNEEDILVTDVYIFTKTNSSKLFISFRIPATLIQEPKQPFDYKPIEHDERIYTRAESIVFDLLYIK